MNKVSHKLDEDDVEQIVELIHEHNRLKQLLKAVSIPAIAEKFGVSTSAIEYIKRNKMRSEDDS
jgi:DNA-binding MurR/RpiR family transcriptional regulator